MGKCKTNSDIDLLKYIITYNYSSKVFHCCTITMALLFVCVVFPSAYWVECVRLGRCCFCLCMK